METSTSMNSREFSGSLHETCDQLEAMIRQEENCYTCPNYFQVDEPQQETFSPLDAVVECANRLTALLLPPPSATPSTKTKHPKTIPASPSRVRSFPSPQNISKKHLNASETRNVLLSGSLHNDGNFQSKGRRNRISSTEVSSLIEWRHQILDFSYALCDAHRINREIVAVSMNLLDRYIASEILLGSAETLGMTIRSEDYQLYGIVCLYISIKLLVPYRKLSIECIIRMSEKFYAEKDIRGAEADILATLRWRVNPPTVMQFCRRYLSLFPNPLMDRTIEMSCQYLSEVALEDVENVPKRASLVALVAVLLATQRCGVSFEETQVFLENLQGLISVQSSEFDVVFQRMEQMF